jgi:hypothetical protein
VSAVAAVAVVSAAVAIVIVRGGITIALASPQHAPPEIPLAPHWGLYSDASWKTIATRFEQRGFAQGSVRIVTGTSLIRNHESFALLSARSKSGRTCFVVVRGTAMGAMICQVSKPLLVFRARDVCIACSPQGQPPLKALTILVLVRHDVSSVQAIDGTTKSFQPLVPAGEGDSAFNGGGRYDTILRARSKTNAILAVVRLARTAG